MPDGNIYIRLEIAKDPITNTLTLITHLNPNAPNITLRENSISWKPTAEEQKFLSQAFQFFSSSKSSTSWSPSQSNVHTDTSYDTDPHQKIEKILQEKTGIS
ncbi:MAG: hypothetical protein DRN12_05405 [Thermoplasmata archaeon]|nr:MAG: hypothetical protein DRN12_05405 [Thermoplasmata archaeon]